MADPSRYRPRAGSIPTDPGVYRFSDPHGQVIYVGKAKNLRQRLNSYFADPASLHPRTYTMVHTAAKVEWTVVASELESLQLEYTWIKLYDPRFNIKYRDDKSYPWVAVTWNEEFPRVFVGRGPKRRGVRYFGPYGQAWAIRETVDLLLRVFPMRSCSAGVFRNAHSSGRPCLLGYIGKCSAPCVGRIDADAHRAIADDLCSFLAGHSSRLERKLTAQMKRASANEEYEHAAVLRDALAALRQASERNAIVLAERVDADLIALAEDPLEVAVQIFHVRGGRVVGERAWVADRTDDATTSELIETFLLQLYAEGTALRTETEALIPPEILVPEGPASGEVLAQLLASERGAKVTIHAPQRGPKHDLLDIVTKNATNTLALHKLKRSSDLSTRNQALAELQDALKLDEAPLRIEGFDISHLQGTEVVGSMVVFEDGVARKSEYRRFVIKTFEGSNDLRAMREVLTRRFRRLLDDRAAMQQAGSDPQLQAAALIDPITGQPRKFAYAPNLLVIDGGAPQVDVAQAVIEELQLSEIAVIGLAKRLEEVWRAGEEYPLILPRNSEALYLLQRVRDESHRFAITHHRGRRSKAMLASQLDAVPGLGEVRRKTLEHYYGSLKKLRAASVDEIAALPGFGPSTAQAVVAAVAATKPTEAINTATGEIVSS